MANESSYYGTAISTRGTPLVGQNVAICSQPANTSTTPCSPLVNTFTDITGATLTGTPGITTTDSLGNFHFYLPSGIYTVQIYGPQVSSPVVQRDLFIPVGTSSDNIFTGTNTFSGTFISTGNNTFASINKVIYVDQQIGATADVKFANSCAALPSGGVMDARGFGGTTQTIAATVACGASLQPITFLFDPATKYIPGSTSVNMFSINNMNVFSGLHADTNNQPAYTGAVLVNSVTNSTLQYWQLEHIYIDMTNNTSTGNCLKFNSTIISIGVQSGYVKDFTCWSNVNASAIVLQNSGSGFINTVHWNGLNLYQMQRGVDIEQAGTGGISSHIFLDLYCEHGNLAGSNACVYINATGHNNGSDAGNSQFFMNAWDLQGTNKAVIITAGSNGFACGNVFQGRLVAVTDNSSACSGNSGSSFNDTTGQTQPGSVQWQFPTLGITSRFIVGAGTAFTGSGVGGTIASADTAQTFSAQQTITTGTSSQLRLFSNNSAVSSGEDLGRNATIEGGFYIPGGAGAFCANAVAGDWCQRLLDNTKSFRFGFGGVAPETLVISNTNITSKAYATQANCAVNSASPAACGSAASGVFAVPTTTTTYTVNTTAITANSRVFIQDITDNTGIPSAPTCTALATFGDGQVSGRVAGTSFTISLPSTAGTTCFNYWIIN